MDTKGCSFLLHSFSGRFHLSFLCIGSATFYLSRRWLKTLVDRLPAVEPLML